MAKPLNVGLIGFGNIGTGVVDLLNENRALIETRVPRSIQITRIADLDITTQRPCQYDQKILTNDVNDLFDDPQIDVIIELIGGYEPARTFVERALSKGKHVVTANKAMLAKFGADLMAEAPEDIMILYEAAVGGGIPLIRTIQQGLPANEIRSIRGIINGTTNFILTAMSHEGMDFHSALAEAQRLGYAEPDPSFDVNGTDVGHKIAVLASLCFGMDIRFEDVMVEGIEKLTPTDFAYAWELDYKIKLLGIAKRESADGPAEVRVSPTLLPENNMLSSVSGVYNAIEITGEPVGPTLYYGQGAGPRATASAVVSDLMAIASATVEGGLARESRMKIPLGQKNLKPREGIESQYYLRLLVSDKPGTMAKLSKALGDQQISIKSMIQHGENIAGDATVIIITHIAKEGAIRKALAEIQNLDINKQEPFLLRVEEA